MARASITWWAATPGDQSPGEPAALEPVAVAQPNGGLERSMQAEMAELRQQVAALTPVHRASMPEASTSATISRQEHEAALAEVAKLRHTPRVQGVPLGQSGGQRRGAAARAMGTLIQVLTRTGSSPEVLGFGGVTIVLIWGFGAAFSVSMPNVLHDDDGDGWRV